MKQPLHFKERETHLRNAALLIEIRKSEEWDQLILSHATVLADNLTEYAGYTDPAQALSAALTLYGCPRLGSAQQQSVKDFMDSELEKNPKSVLIIALRKIHLEEKDYKKAGSFEYLSDNLYQCRLGDADLAHHAALLILLAYPANSLKGLKAALFLCDEIKTLPLAEAAKLAANGLIAANGIDSKPIQNLVTTMVSMFDQARGNGGLSPTDAQLQRLFTTSLQDHHHALPKQLAENRLALRGQFILEFPKVAPTSTVITAGIATRTQRASDLGRPDF